MKTLCLMFVVFLAAGAAAADCGVKDTHQGTLKSVDAKSHSAVVVVEDGKEVKLELTDKTMAMDAEGNKVKPAKLVGTKVKVTSEHSKIDSIEQTA